MENSSNNKAGRQRHLLWGLCLLLCLPLGGFAQQHFSRLYTLYAHASQFDAVAPHGGEGGCMAIATIIDSATGRQGVRIGRYDEAGNQLASAYFNVPDDTDRRLYVNDKAMTRVHDNCYAAMIMVEELKRPGLYSLILLADSNGKVYRQKELTYSDSVNELYGIAYDGWGHIIAAGTHFFSDTSENLLFYKLDTALNMLWVKSYHPKVLMRAQLTQNLVVDDDGYMLCGGGQNTGLKSYKEYKCQAFLFRTDTAGAEQWIWTSPTSKYTEYNSHIGSVLHTADGGYLFTTMGRTFNYLPPSAPGIELKAKQMIVKLDAARNKLWETVVDDYYTGFGFVRSSLIELEDNSFIFLGGRTTDSTAPNYQKGKLVLQHYSSKGDMLYQHIINDYIPKMSGDTSSESGGPIYDIRQLQDNSFLLCGYYENRTPGAPLPKQRGWLLKLDSNGCLGPGDPQCDPAGIPPVQKEAIVFKIFPNPSDGNMTIVADRRWAGTATIYDLLGKIIYREAVHFKSGPAAIRIQATSGLYILELKDKEGNIYHDKIEIRN